MIGSVICRSSSARCEKTEPHEKMDGRHRCPTTNALLDRALKVDQDRRYAVARILPHDEQRMAYWYDLVSHLRTGDGEQGTEPYRQLDQLICVMPWLMVDVISTSTLTYHVDVTSPRIMKGPFECYYALPP